MPGASATAHYDMGEDGRPKHNVGFSEVSVRNGFIRKVFSLVFMMLLVVAGMVALFTFAEGPKMFVQRNPWMYWLSYGTFLATFITLVCCEGPRRKHPFNLILTGVLTLAIGYMTAMIAARYKTEIVFFAAAITAAVCGSIIVFASQTKYDFTGWIGPLFVVSMVLLFFGIAAIIVSIFAPGAGRIMYLVYAGLAALLFSVYLAVDVQLIIGGKKIELSPEEYILAAIMLFLDIIYIFWMILSLIGGVSNN